MRLNFHHALQLCFFLTGIFFSTICIGQQISWASDSLSYYEKTFWSQISAKDYSKSKKTLAYIQDKAFENLDDRFLEFFKNASTIEIPSPETVAYLHSVVGNLEYYKGDLIASKAAFTKAKTFYVQANKMKDVAGMAMNIGVMEENSSNYDAAIVNFREAEKVFEKEKDTVSMVKVNINIGLLYFNLDQYEKALENYITAENLLNDFSGESADDRIHLYFNKYLVLAELYRHNEGLEVLLMAKELADAIGNQDRIGKFYFFLASYYRYKNEFDKEYQALMQSKSYLQTSKNLKEVANLNSSLLRYHTQFNNYDSAYYYAQKCLDFFEPYEYGEEVGVTYGQLGNLEMSKKDYAAAIAYYKKALDNFLVVNTGFYAGQLFNMGYAYLKSGNFDQALDQMGRSLAIRKEIKDLNGLSESYKGLAETYQAMGNYKNAFDYLVIHQSYKDSVFNETKNRQLTELETQYETEKKNQAISVLEQEKELQNLKAQKQQAQISIGIGAMIILLALLGLFFRQSNIRKKLNDQLQSKNEEIAKQSAERELLLKEIHHRVKNNLQIISSLLSMQTRSFTDDKMKGAMKESQSRVKTMALIHEKLYQYENLSKINMQEYLKELSEFLAYTYRSEKQIELKIDAENIDLDMDLAIPLGLITNELLSNSLKYAFQEMDSGEIIINFSKNALGLYNLTIKDTGKGLDDSLDLDKTTSLGLKLVKTLTRQINGELRVVNQTGVAFEINFGELDKAA